MLDFLTFTFSVHIQFSRGLKAIFLSPNVRYAENYDSKLNDSCGSVLLLQF